ncbi:SUKH-4 family immunity protein [Nonomuraea purpurea]|uniref:SUKH-4 family immunity protein n=1 Tax=Nonomuraea purpurea TaxID=1849276 RepID=A0ABV8G8K1_9ACTN
MWVLDADLAAAFDRIDHTRLLEAIGSFPARDMIRGCAGMAWLSPAPCTHDKPEYGSDARVAEIMKLPTHLPQDLSGAFRAVGLPWPDLRLDLLDEVVAELGEGPDAELLRDHVRVMRKAQRVFFEHLRDLSGEHGGHDMRLIRHKDRPCVSEVREKWAATAAQMTDFHAVVVGRTRVIVRRLDSVPGVPDYLDGDRPAWLERRPDRGIRRDVTGGRAPAAEALVRWREDPFGPRVCAVTGSAAAGKTWMLAWFSRSSVQGWSGYPDDSEAAVWLRDMDVETSVSELARQLGLDRSVTDPAGLLAALDRPVLITLADPHHGADPERLLAELVRPLADDPRVRLLVELPDAAALSGDTPYFALNLDDSRCTDRDAFAEWYTASSTGHTPFTADQVYPSPVLAAFAARVQGADTRPDLPIAERVASAWLETLSPAARAAVGTLALARAPIAPYLWRLLHCGLHRDDPETAARGVAEAVAHLPLAEPDLPAYAAALPALGGPPSPEAHRGLVAVTRGWPNSSELSPPEYVRRHLAGHERLAGAVEPIAPLPLVRPPITLTRDLLESLYGEAGVTRLSPDEIHPAITHEPTRRFLAEIGLSVNGVFQDGPFQVKPVTEWWSEENLRELRACVGLPGDLGTVFMLDDLHTWCLLLDGGTGLVYEVPEGLESALVAHRSIESYAYFAYVIHRERRLWCDEGSHFDAAYWCAEDLVLELHTYEPQTMAGDDRLWPVTLLDYTLLT